MTPFFSIIIPVHNGGEAFQQCLQALAHSTFQDWELIVVDDGSEDASAAIAHQYNATIYRAKGSPKATIPNTEYRIPNTGPAAARNQGVSIATGHYLFFLDADCAVHHDTLTRAAAILQTNPHIDALFGSYDDTPSAPNFTSQYKNLAHHFVHQTSSIEASTFWTGCGVIKRTIFEELGGFDAQRYPRPAIEDIELGYRLKAMGGTIRLAKQVQVTHLKRWTVSSMIVSDIRDRAIPWTQLLLENESLEVDLNLQWHNRLSALAVLFLPIVRRKLPLIALLLMLNADFYRFLWRKRGLWFACRAIPLHWLTYAYSALAYTLVVTRVVYPPLVARVANPRYHTEQ